MGGGGKGWREDWNLQAEALLSLEAFVIGLVLFKEIKTKNNTLKQGSQSVSIC